METSQDPRECKHHMDRFCYLRYENHGYWLCSLIGRNPYYGSKKQDQCPDFTPKTENK